jgi:hypothetical protein
MNNPRCWGADQVHPTIWQSYNPAQPLNEAQYGKSHQRGARPKLTQITQFSNGIPPKNVAIRGLEINQGNIGHGGSVGLISDGASGHDCSNFLFENNLCPYAGISFDLNGYPAHTGTNTTDVDYYPSQHIVVRGNAFYGMWTDAGDGRTGGMYAAGARYFTNEYNVFYHCGWKIDPAITWDSSLFIGGASVFSHSWYMQMNTDDNIVRGNLTSEAGGDAGTLRGSGIWYGNVSIRNPNAASLGGGSPYATGRPMGTYIDAGYNVAINAVNQTSTHQLGWGMTALNGLPGRFRVHHNLLLRSDIAAQDSAQGFGNTSGTNLASYAEFDQNVMYRFIAPPGVVFNNSAGAFPNRQHARAIYNIWDGPTDTFNLNSGTYSFPNPMTEADLYTAFGFADFNAFITYCCAHPEAKTWIALRDMVMPAYGISMTPPADVTAPVLSSPGRTVTGNTTATLVVTTNEANGRMYWVRTLSATPPSKYNIVMGIDDSETPTDDAGSFAVTATGVQTLNATITTPATYYYHFCHEDQECNKSTPVSTASVVIVGNVTTFSTDPALKSADVTVTTVGGSVQKYKRTAATQEYWARAESSQPKNVASVIVDIIANPGGTFGGFMFGWDNGDPTLHDKYAGQDSEGISTGYFFSGAQFWGAGNGYNLSEAFAEGGRYRFNKNIKVFSVDKWNAGTSAWDSLGSYDFNTDSSWGAPGVEDVAIFHQCRFFITCGNSTSIGCEFNVDWSGF